MARKVILDTGYSFVPGVSGAGVLTIPRSIKRENLILITNVTKNIVIYNFSDPSLKATSYNITTSGGNSTTTISFEYDTSAMSTGDKIQIVVDDYDERFTPSETYLDPVNKIRVSEPQALIDTDFEYGTQTTKWENLTLTNNRPFSYPSSVPISNISAISLPTSSRTVTVSLSSGTAPANGTFISVQDTFLNIANGNFVIESGGGTGSFTYSANGVNTSSITDIFDTNKTAIYRGSVYKSAAIGGTPTITTSGTAVNVITTIPHGLAIGNEVAITGIIGTNPPNGAYSVARIISSTEFVYYASATPSALTTSAAVVYVIPQGQFLHRPFDGGVIFSANSGSNYDVAVRQTRRYFRYQSGKGIMVSSGTIIKPNLQVDSVTANGTTITVNTKEKHNIQPGTVVTITGASPSTYNGTFTITSITGLNTFEYTVSTSISASDSPASGLINVGVTSWYGASNRMGLFDSQNGVFYEFDGQALYACRRKSTFQISGKVSVTNGSSTVTQTNSTFATYFTKQLNPGDFIVIRGQSYRVVDIASDTSLTISPTYRGATASYCVVSLTEDTKTPQSQWNIDKCDGTGPSGFTIDFSKMQMFYIDYSWYGAGFVRWGFRGPNGDVIYVHKVANNNVNNEAYMRSGNLPARYESSTEPAKTVLAQTLASGDSTLYVRSTSGFPSTGTVLVRNANSYEYMNYSGVGSTTFTNLIRARSGGSPTITLSQNSNVATATTTNLQIGQRVIATGVPDGTFITSVGSGSITMNRAATTSGAQSSTIVAIGTATPMTFTYSATDPIAVEMAYPTFSPTISHWGTSVIMDGKFDDDKSLIFTYGQVSSVTLGAGLTRALLAIRVAPSVDNSIGGIFGARELINRMQLTLNTLDIVTQSLSSTSLLVRAYLNSTPSSTISWTNAVGNVANTINSSLAQIADYSASANVTLTGGEVVAGFFIGGGAASLDLSRLRNLGNSILGGGGTNSNDEIYPDGPDTLTLTVTNLTSSSVNVFGRISWTEAQA
jgi:hypothetical protein